MDIPKHARLWSGDVHLNPSFSGLWKVRQQFIPAKFDSDGTLSPALEPNRAAAALAQPSKILPVVAPIHPAQFNPGNTIKWNKVL
jgi:hypothetical protein